MGVTKQAVRNLDEDLRRLLAEGHDFISKIGNKNAWIHRWLGDSKRFSGDLDGIGRHDAAISGLPNAGDHTSDGRTLLKQAYDLVSHVPGRTGEMDLWLHDAADALGTVPPVALKDSEGQEEAIK